jgi:hypothetical protein
MINSPKLTLTDEQQSQVKFDVTHAVEAIGNWKAHMLRTVNQEQAKEETLGALNDQSVLVIMDWAMKYLPQRYREQMSDFYGKRGKSWHVACVVFKSGENEFSVETIVHIFDSCIQDWFSVASIVEHVLVTIKQEHPNVKMAYLKSDNAGCYHNASLILSLKSIGERTGISVRRCDFSDPQSGKDVCDRKIAPMKGHIRTQGDLQGHMDTGRHVRVTEPETVYDLARKEWAEKVTGIQSTHVGETGHARASSHSMSTRKAPLQGWALKTHRKGQRATEIVKNFLLEKFNRGVKTGKFTLQGSSSDLRS